MAEYKTTFSVTVTSEKPFVNAKKVEKSEAWLDAALTMGFGLLGTVSKYGISNVDINAEVSEKLDK